MAFNLSLLFFISTILSKATCFHIILLLGILLVFALAKKYSELTKKIGELRDEISNELADQLQEKISRIGREVTFMELSIESLEGKLEIRTNKESSFLVLEGEMREYYISFERELEASHRPLGRDCNAQKEEFKRDCNAPMEEFKKSLGQRNFPWDLYWRHFVFFGERRYDPVCIKLLFFRKQER